MWSFSSRTQRKQMYPHSPEVQPANQDLIRAGTALHRLHVGSIGCFIWTSAAVGGRLGLASRHLRQHIMRPEVRLVRRSI